MIDQIEAMSNTSIVMGQSFDASQNDDFFYLPPEAFSNPEFLRGVKMFFSPTAKSVRFFITFTSGDPMTPEGNRPSVRGANRRPGRRSKQSSLSDAKVYLGGTAATFKDMHDGAKYDLMIAVVASLTLIFMIMLLLTRRVVAALLIVGTAASSIAASFGLSVLIWQDLFGIHIHWIVAALSVIILLAVGSDYNLLLVSRFKEEIHAGLKTGSTSDRWPQTSGGDLCGSGVRRHHGGDAGQRAPRAGPSSARRSASACCWTPWWCARCSCPRSPPCWAAGSGGLRLSIPAATYAKPKPPPAGLLSKRTTPPRWRCGRISRFLRATDGRKGFPDSSKIAHWNRSPGWPAFSSSGSRGFPSSDCEIAVFSDLLLPI